MGKRHRRDYFDSDPMMVHVDQRANAMTSNGNEPRKHHLVPKFYLERWAESGMLRATDLDTHKSFTQSPGKVARQTDFYRLEEGTFRGSPIWWEAFLSVLEERVADSLKILDSTQLTELSPESLAEVHWFVALQFTRGVTFRRNLQWTALQDHLVQFEYGGDDTFERKLRANRIAVTPERVDRMRSQLAEMSADPEKLPMLKAAKVRQSAVLAAQMIPYLTSRKMILYQTANRLTTSDEPVAPLAPDMGAPFAELGIANAPIIVLPISPCRVIAMFRHDFPVMLDYREQLTVEETISLNSAMLGNANRFGFERPSMNLTERLFVPPRPSAGERAIIGKTEDGGDIHQLRPGRRWRGQPDAPLLPVKRWWVGSH